MPSMGELEPGIDGRTESKAQVEPILQPMYGRSLLKASLGLN